MINLLVVIAGCLVAHAMYDVYKQTRDNSNY